jgi:hypothetical protein
VSEAEAEPIAHAGVMALTTAFILDHADGGC